MNLTAAQKQRRRRSADEEQIAITISKRRRFGTQSEEEIMANQMVSLESGNLNARGRSLIIEITGPG